MPDSSPETVVDATTTTDTTAAVNADQNSDANRSESSTEQAGNMLDAVKSALEPKEASPASQEPDQAADAASDDSKKDQEKGEEEGDELSEEELKAVSQRTQKRFRHLTSKIKAKDAEIDGLRPKAQEFDKISKFVADAGLSGEEVGFVLSLGAQIKSDPTKALEQLLPMVEALQRQVGEVLPADLQEEVRLGYITQERARELNKARASERLERERREKTETATRDAEQQRQAKELIDTTLGAIEKWEAAKAGKDPDWHLKRTDVSEKVELAIIRGQRERKNPNWFPTAEEAIKLSDDALKEVNKRFKSPKPAITPIQGDASNRSAPKPTSMFDVVKNAVAG